MSLKSRIKYRMAELNMNATQVSRSAGFAATFVRDILKDRKKSVGADSLIKLAEALRVDPQWLNGEGRLEDSGGAVDAPSTETFVSIPIFDIRASAGDGAFSEDGEPTGYQPFREPEIAHYNPNDLAVIRVAGDSMWETLHHGDKVLINRADRKIVEPGIYILSYEGTLIVKRCQRNLETGAVIVQSDNPDYETFTVTDADALDVIGRVVWIGRSLG